MKSKITGGQTKELFKAKVLGKYDVQYYQCVETGFIQTEEPFWLDEAYSSAIASLDLGLVMRNQNLCLQTKSIIEKNFNPDLKFLDFAGGYGLFTRMMRDKGLDFYHTDKYCDNLFAKYFDIDSEQSVSKFELTTAFEVFEHLSNPIEEINNILKFSDNLLFSTEILPVKTLVSAEDWWYFVPEIGQHISFYTIESLKYIARLHNFNFYSNGVNLHLFTKLNLNDNVIFKSSKESFWQRKVRKYYERLSNKKNTRKSLLDHDINFIKQKLI
jgi:hypothetical protein